MLALVAALTFRDYGLGWDDFTHAQYGDLLLSLYASGFHDTRALSFVNLYLYGGGFDMAAALLAKVLPFDLFETRRLLGAAVGIAGLAITWRIGRRIGGPLAGLLALVLLAACPLYYGHMFMNSEGRAVRGGDGAVPARPRPPARPISEALPDHALHRRAWLRSLDRLAHHGGLWRARSDRRAGAAVCDRGARRRRRAWRAAALAISCWR